MSTTPRIAVVDYGAGNLRSVAKALLRSGLEPEVTADPAAVRAAQAVVLPGVGAFADAVSNLREKGLAEAVLASIEVGRPYLGICLGLQVLFDESEEHGRTQGLGLLSGRVERFAERDAAGSPLRVPHIGWNRVVFEGSHPMCARMPREGCFYFVHSYRAVPAQAWLRVGCADYGGEFAAAIALDNVFAVQFHPEKSQSAGKRLLDAFAGWVASCA
ncbi:MAG TPA: imidazole glycerol phosphate synthase subunit HisH [Myxococcota bacterium]